LEDMVRVRKPTWAELESAYKGRRVLVTGHTGFKGAWLTIWLHALGAEVTGASLQPPTTPSLFEIADVGQFCEHRNLDVRNLAAIREMVRRARPDFVFHLAAQSLVRSSYSEPLETISTNVLGTATLLEAIRLERVPSSVVVVTSDKCYENCERAAAYREEDRLGGRDPYSMSKGAAELVTASYRQSFFPVEEIGTHGIALASVRAGNVIGGGDWAVDRIVPDAIRALSCGRAVQVRNPSSVRPWQHVLEPLSGYLLLGSRLLDVRSGHADPGYASAWNFGPTAGDSVTVGELVTETVRLWGSGTWEAPGGGREPHEARVLRLDVEKAKKELEWWPRWDVNRALRETVDWYREHHLRSASFRAAERCVDQIRAYMNV
jgi:CDP-glucose 4,6-dehydratase